MSEKEKTDMDEVRDLWEKEQDKKEEAAINQAGEELFTGMRKPEDSTPIKHKAKPIFAKPGAPEVGKFSRKLFKEGGRKKKKSRKRKRKGGTSDLCKLYKDGIVERGEANEYCAKFYLEDGSHSTPGSASSLLLRPANRCNDQGQCYREESEIDMMRAYLDRQAAASAGTGGTGGRRKTRRKKRKKKKRKTKKRRKRKKRKTKKRYRNQRGCKR